MEVEPGHIVMCDGERKIVIDVAEVDVAPGEEQYDDGTGHCLLATLRSPGDGNGNDSAMNVTAAYCNDLEIVGRL